MPVRTTRSLHQAAQKTGGRALPIRTANREHGTGGRRERQSPGDLVDPIQAQIDRTWTQRLLPQEPIIQAFHKWSRTAFVRSFPGLVFRLRLFQKLRQQLRNFVAQMPAIDNHVERPVFK